MLRSLGVAGDTDAGVTLVENLDELVGEIVDDLYLQRFGDVKDTPALTRAQALELAHEVVRNPRTRLTPIDPPAETTAGVRRAFADDVVRELERRKRLLGILGFDDLLCRLAVALEADDAPARDRMRRRWWIVMVDEFQDTDPVQWEVIERAFVGQVTLVLIGDPKQAIYAFRGGDVVTYLRARDRADALLTLDTNYRSDAPLVQRLLRVLEGAALGHDDIVVRDVAAHRTDPPAGRRAAPTTRSGCGWSPATRSGSAAPAPSRWTTCARSSPPTSPPTSRRCSPPTRRTTAAEVRARDVAVIVESHRDARACRDALAAAGVPAVYTGDTDVFASQAAADWQCLLEAFEQPGRSGLVRAAAATMFFGRTAAELATDADLTDEVAETLRRWADHARARGIAAVLEAAYVAGMAQRVLAWRGGERHLTDVEHLTQLLHEVAHREGLGLPALLQWLRKQREERAGAAERNRRLDSDAAAVQIMTVWVSKGLQYPLVYLPFAFNRNVRMGEAVLYHEPDGTRCLDIGGSGQPGYQQVAAKGRAEMAGDDIRLTYVALTRAQSQVVAWWAPSWDEVNGGLSRLLRGRVLGQAAVPDSLPPKVDDAQVLDHLRKWEAAGGPRLERAEPAADAPEPAPAARRPPTSGSAASTAPIDVDWRRTSYSALIRAAEETGGVTSEPELSVRDDELADELADEPDDAEPVPAPDEPGALRLADGRPAVRGGVRLARARRARGGRPGRARPRGRAARPRRGAAGLVAGRGARRRAGRGAGAAAPHLARSAGRRADPRRDRAGRPALRARLRDPAGRRRRRTRRATWRWPTSARCSSSTSPPTTRCGPTPRGCGRRAWAASRCAATSPAPSTWCSGCPGPAGPRYLVVDYKTNWLGPADEPLTAAAYARARLVEAMLHSDYPLQALLYVVVVHRYLRWRQPGYDPARHLGGVLYLYVRGMCGPETPEEDGHPAGVFSWQPPAALVTALSDLLDGAPMTLLVPELEDPHDPRLARAADGLLRTFNEAGVLDASDVHVARALTGAGRGRRASGRAGRGVRGARGARRLGLRRPGRGGRRGARTRPALARPGRVVRRAGGQPAGQPATARCCASSSTTGCGCSTSTATGARRSRCTPTWSAARPPRRHPTTTGWPRRSTGSSRPRATTSSGPPPGSR